jgi:hypothetical protein
MTVRSGSKIVQFKDNLPHSAPNQDGEWEQVYQQWHLSGGRRTISYFPFCSLISKGCSPHCSALRTTVALQLATLLQSTAPEIDHQLLRSRL